MNLISSAFALTTLLPIQAVSQGISLRGQQPQLSSRETLNPDVFEAAISLEDFKNVDPDKFEWVNPDEIKAGEIT